MFKPKIDTMLGYRRSAGWGIRNHCLVLSAMDLVNGIVTHIGELVRPSLSMPIWYGRGQYGCDGQLMQQTLGGLIQNPNVGGVVIVSLEEQSARELLAVAEKAQKLAHIVVMQEVGSSVDAIALGAQYATEIVSSLSMAPREPMIMKDLIVGMECGASDTTSGIVANPAIGQVADAIIDAGGTVIFSETAELVGAEEILRQRAVNAHVADQILAMIRRVEEEAMRRNTSLLGTNPSPDNIRGGLSSLEEKALGSIIKGGSRPITGVLSYAQTPHTSGLYIMDTPSPASESLTGLAAGGCQLFLFSTGQGNPVGFPMVPTIKISANPDTAAHQRLDVDCDLSPALSDRQAWETVQEIVWERLSHVVNGQLTRSEILGMGTVAFNRIEPTV